MKVNPIIFLFLLIGINLKAQSPSPAVATDHPSSVDASTPKAFASAGCVELGGSASFTNESYGGASSSNSQLVFAPYVGWFPMQGLELGLNPLSISTSFGSGRTNSAILVLFAPSYNFSTGSMAHPFLEADIGLNSIIEDGLSDESGLSVGGRAGVKLEIAKHALLNISLQYLRNNFTQNGLSIAGVNNLVLGVGFTVYI